jgi:hypothetical protein
MALGLISYLAAFFRGPGPTMGDDTVQASLFSVGVIALMVGFILVVI